MDSHFGDAINLHHIADEACFSKFHFIRLFKSIYGKTPHQYLVSVQIEKAKELLQKDHSVTETCFSVGFNSLPSFTSLFRRYTQCSPSAFQWEYRKRQEQIRAAPLEFIPNCFAEQKGWTEKSNFE
jgi:AraC-like DNA-binding protein